MTEIRPVPPAPLISVKWRPATTMIASPPVDAGKSNRVVGVGPGCPERHGEAAIGEDLRILGGAAPSSRSVRASLMRPSGQHATRADGGSGRPNAMVACSRTAKSTGRRLSGSTSEKVPNSVP